MASIADTGGQAPPSPPEEEVVVVRRRSVWWTISKWLGILLGVLVALVVALLIWINSDSGRRFIVERINGLEMASGLRIHVDRIDGSIWGEMSVHGLTLSDPQGAFFAAPRADLNYSPLSYIRRSHIEIHSLAIPEARLARLPQLRSTDPNAPLIPNILLDIGSLRVDRLMIDPPVTGNRHLLSIAGDIHLANSAARTNLQVNALQGPGIAGGDRLNLRLDAAPQDNRLGIEMRVQAPAGGFVSSMTGLDKPLDVAVAGKGDWANWQGRTVAFLAGQPFANVSVKAQNGTFTFNGPMRPDLFVTGPAQRLTAPLTQFNLVTTWANRRAELNLTLNSRAAAIVAEGAVDFRQNRFEGLSVAARLLQPGAIAPNLGGRDLRIAMVLDGAMRTPRVAYDLRAASLTISGRTLENFRATGAARVDPDRITIPIAASATRLTGLPDALGGLLTNVRMNGDILVQGDTILSDNLRLRSDRADAVLALAFDIGDGRYNVGIQGRVNDYLIQSVGIVDITSDFDIVTRANGFGMQGRVGIRTRRIFNQSAVDLLGGNAVASATVALGGDGGIRFGDVRVTAPALRITQGGGVYYPDGRIALQLRGTSTRYGAISVTVGGTITSPQVQLNVGSPGFGIGLANVQASVRATAQGYAIVATGDSAYGRFSADVVILGRGGPMTIQVNRVLVAGMTFAGRISQTAAGPFAGSLSVTGQGINGNVALAAAGRRQRVEIMATAQNATIPSSIAGQNDITVQRAIIDVGITLPIAGDRFAVYEARGDVQVAGLQSGALTVTRGRTIFNYAGNGGNARFVLAGSSGVPFDIAGNADLSPDRIRAALQGTANNIPFRFAQPALIERVGSDWLLRPATILFQEGQGSLRLAGRWGNGLIIQSRLDNLDLSIANTVRPGLGIGGQATGSLDFYMPSGGAFPRSEARLNIQNFTRTGLAMRSVPVNIALSGNLLPEGGAIAAVIRQNDVVVGRLQARLQPLPPGSGTWNQRLMASPLAGGIRYNGPASVLMSLAGVAGHQVEGPVGVGADFTGRVNNPQFVGVVRSNNLTYTNETYGTRITNIAMDGRFDGSQLTIVQMTGRAGEGTVRIADGRIGLSSAAGYPVDINLELANAQLARSDDLSATATGDLRILRTPQLQKINGNLSLAEARYQIVRQGAAQISQLSGVRRRGVSPEQERQQRQRMASAQGGEPWQLEINLDADNRVFVSGMGLESEWSADLDIRGSTAAPTMAGRIELERGTLSLAGRRFTLDDKSRIDFSGGNVINPQLNIIAVSDIEDVEVQILIEGFSTDPRITFASSPGLPQDEIVSRILFGSSVTEISAIQAIQLAASLNSLRGGSGGLDPIGALRNATGIDRLRILGEDDTTGRGTAVAAGFYLSDDIYVEIITDARGFTATQLEFSLSKALSLLSQFGTTTGTNVNLRYSRDY
jgi:translocation and assembly module TamB